jgi:serine/threonine protein kinase
MESDIKTRLTKAFQEINAQVIDESDIVFQNEIGRGGFGVVHKGLYKDSVEVAIKEMINVSTEHYDSENERQIIEDMTDIINEIRVMIVANNIRFPKFYGVVINEKINLVFELIKGDTLSFIHNSGILSRNNKLDIVFQLCEILENLVDMKIIHRDIKPANIMVEDGNKIRLIDFGIARISTKTQHFTKSGKMTVNYMPPEVLEPKALDKKDTKPFAITPKLDVWSCGCVLSELFSNIEPWSNKCKNTLAITRALIRKEKFPIPDSLDEEIKDVVLKACENDTTKRLTAKEMKLLLAELLQKS